jgi:predicted DNA repair protein MutK
MQLYSIITKKGNILATGFFALLDDIAVLMDDISTMTKTATKNTAAILGDDLAVNASKASTFSSSRELPVLWKITKGSILNKIILIPLIMTLNYYYPSVVIYLLIAGGLFLSYEGTHAIWEYIFPHNEESELKKEPRSEDEKVKSAILTDFILSIEIVLIALSSVTDAPFKERVVVVSLVSLLATVGVYALVAFLVRIDDFGLSIANGASEESFKYKFGMSLVTLLPIIIRILSVVGTIAMLIVAGEIFLHNIHLVQDILHQIPNFMAALIASLIAGGVVMMFVNSIKWLVGFIKK